MHRDPAVVRRWFLSVLAGCVLLVWLLALFGMGGWIAEPDATAVVPWTPPAMPNGSERLELPENYAEMVARPLWATDRRPHRFVIDAGEPEAMNGPDFILTGVLITPILEVAIFTPVDGGEPVRVRRGDGLPSRMDWQLLSIAPRQVVFQTPEGLIQFELHNSDDGILSGTPLMMTPAPHQPAGLNARAGDLEHQARIEALRNQVAARAQMRKERSASSNQNH